MSGAVFIIAINLLVAGLFCATFVAIAIQAPHFRSARWFAAAYALGAVYSILEFVIPAVPDARLAGFLAHAAFLTAVMLLDIGLARHYGLAVPRTLLAVAFGLSLVVSALIIDMPRDWLLRLIAYQAPFAVMQAIGVTIVLRAARRTVIDNLLAVILGFNALYYLSKPLMARLTGGPGASSQDYLGTAYAMVSQATGAVLVVAMGLLLLAMLIADALREATERSETDPLSGLLNRRGFEQRLADSIARREANGLPTALVLADLDHFKQVNDSYGHAVGDRLIVEFATAMRRVASGHHIVARIGGEEFAAVLPGSNLAAGRLFAEAVRAAYAEAAPAHVPGGVRCTASFGVAEFGTGDIAASIMERADAALYAAKRGGRDAVRVAHLETITLEVPGNRNGRSSSG